MKYNGENISNLQGMEKILRNLIVQFEYKVTITEQLKDLNTMMLDELMGSLQAHEQRLDERSQIEAEESIESQVSLRKENMNLKIILNQIRMVRIDRIECKLKFYPCLDGEFLKLPNIYISIYIGTMINFFYY